MPRARAGSARHRRKKRLFKAVRGYRDARSHRYRLAKEAYVRSGVYAFRDRRARKRDFRALWITRLTAACRARGLMYSRFTFALKAAGIELNRKMLSEIAIHRPEDFDAIVELARPHLPKAESAAA